jgi:hypothetical protein
VVKGRPQRPEWRQERGENCIQQLVDLQKEPSRVYLMSDVNGVVKCHKVVDKNLNKYLLKEAVALIIPTKTL